MSIKTGKIGVTTENIFPIIKKFLYSEHEIFLRELVSNAVDASQKVKALAQSGEFKGELGDLTIQVNLDKEAKTLTISDRGLGMTSEEIDKYINQIAFSSANDFLDKYKDQIENIIGHFGLGFYSSFMVSEKVEIHTKSWQEGAQAIKWSCDGSPEFTIENIEKEQRGTDIVLFFDAESQEFIEDARIEGLLNRYCRFLPIPIGFGQEQEWKEDKMVDTGKNKIINDTNPVWKRKPADLKDKDYQEFYQKLYPGQTDSMFNIHLNVDYPFNLTGILYFPKIKKNFDIQKNKIQLYSNQVFVTDSVEGIVPEYMTLLHGVLDSPDIPLNVSRSYLQGDPNVKKISSHITKKVADKLKDIFKNDREQFEKKWDDLKLFVNYGMLSDDKFNDRLKEVALYKNTEDKFFTFEEYKNIVKENQTDKNNKIVFLYTHNSDEQYSFIQAAKNKGYDVLVLDGQLDPHIIQNLETKDTDIKFARVDSDTIDKLVEKDEVFESKLTSEEEKDLTPVFRSHLKDKDFYIVSFQAMGEEDMPITITQSEFMRRMKDMSEMGGGGMGFYGELPDSYNMVVNSNHPLVGQLNEACVKATNVDLSNVKAELKELGEQKEALETLQKDKKEEEIPQEEKDKMEEITKKTEAVEKQKEGILTDFGKDQKIVSQLIDLALLANGMLKGEPLSKFVKRSVELIEK
ncbi:MAG: molecular chaperone HtpG [Bacteroidales bacterium]|nr:molecular chaperone HtpG [Bacteroidales bacterium]